MKKTEDKRRCRSGECAKKWRQKRRKKRKRQMAKWEWGVEDTRRIAIKEKKTSVIIRRYKSTTITLIDLIHFLYLYPKTVMNFFSRISLNYSPTFCNPHVFWSLMRSIVLIIIEPDPPMSSRHHCYHYYYYSYLAQHYHHYYD